MRLKLTLQMNGLHLPFDYRRGIQAFIYSCLSHASAKDLHDQNDGEVKLFTFSKLDGRVKRDETGLIFSDTAVLWIASPYQILLSQIYQRIMKSHFVDLYGNYVPVLEMDPQENPVYRGPVWYRTISPVTLYTTEENGFRRYYSPEEDNYEDQLLMNISHKYEQIFHDDMDEYFHFYMADHIVKRRCTYKGFIYTAYDFTCKIDTTETVHQIIMDCGLGARNAAGLGMMALYRQ